MHEVEHAGADEFCPVMNAEQIGRGLVREYDMPATAYEDSVRQQVDQRALFERVVIRKSRPVAAFCDRSRGIRFA